jgi:hypothetical protein
LATRAQGVSEKLIDQINWWQDLSRLREDVQIWAWSTTTQTWR